MLPEQSHHESRLVQVMGEIIMFLADELREARKRAISPEDEAILNHLVADAKRRARRLQRLDAKTPPTPAPAP